MFLSPDPPIRSKGGINRSAAQVKDVLIGRDALQPTAQVILTLTLDRLYLKKEKHILIFFITGACLFIV